MPPSKSICTAKVLVNDYISYYKAIFARTLFGTHAVVTVWRTTVLMGPAYWALCFGVVLLSAEYIVTMWIKMGEDWPWISPSTLCYLATVGASLWVQKLQDLGHVQGTNGSTLATVPSTSMELDFSATDWLLLTEQTMMVTIILSRWLLPKGEMTQTALSSLLLLYLGLSADILDFSTIFNEPKVSRDKTFCYVLLLIWTASLCQFFLVLTTTSKTVKEEKITMKSIVCSSEVWQILVQVGLQDFPFLIIRLVVMLVYQVFNYTIIFFVCKNTLVISLEINHMVGLCLEQRKKLKRRQARMGALKDKLKSAKDTIALARKNPFNMLALKTKTNSNDQEDGDGTVSGSVIGTKIKDDNRMNSVCGAGVYAGSNNSKQLKRLKSDSSYGASLDDGYATSPTGSQTSFDSTERDNNQDDAGETQDKLSSGIPPLQHEFNKVAPIKNNGFQW